RMYDKSGSYIRTELDRDSMSNIATILLLCASSSSTDMKKFALQINRDIPEALTTDPSTAAEFFKKLLDDSNKDIRDAAITSYWTASKRYDYDLQLQCALYPIIMTEVRKRMRVPFL
ncbi:hypothetical protein PENTCL1PPCAC_25547, partial [Pristionchus entomophagus]